MTHITFDRRDVRPSPSRCPRQAILSAMERAKGLTERGLHGQTVLSVACPTTLAIAAHHVEGRHEEAIRDGELFLPPIVRLERGRFDALVLDHDALIEMGAEDLLRRAGVMAVLREAYPRVGRTMEAAHMGAYLKDVATAWQLRRMASDATML